MRDEISARVRIVGHVRLHHLPAPQISVGHHAAAGHGISIERVSSAQNGEVGQADFVRVPIDEGGHAEVAGVDRVLGYVQLKVSSVVEFGPLELAVVSNEEGTSVVGCLDRNVLPVRAGARNCGAGKFDANAALSSARVVF